MLEYGLDSLERRYYRPQFRFDFGLFGCDAFAEVQYHSRMNGRLQGAIDYWANVGLQKSIRPHTKFEFRLNHFCRHDMLRDMPYVWNLNEVLGKLWLTAGQFDFALGYGGYLGGSEGYRRLAIFNGEWRRFIIPELTLAAELKWVNFARVFHEYGFSLALNDHTDLFFRNTRHYEFRNTSYLGLRFKSAGNDEALLESMKMCAGIFPCDNLFKLEIEGGFRLEFFKKQLRRIVLGVDFEMPILKGDSFLAQFWPGKMLYGIGLDYEKKVKPRLYVAWVARYRLDMPVDQESPFAASLFSGLAIRNQANFDELAQEVRYEFCSGYDFKHGLEFNGKLAFSIWKNQAAQLFYEIRSQVDAQGLRADFRLLGNFGRTVQIRPFIGWDNIFYFTSTPAADRKFIFGVEFFKSFL